MGVQPSHIVIVASTGNGGFSVNSEDEEIWGLNHLHRHVPTYDRWFFIYPSSWPESPPPMPEASWLRLDGRPIYLTSSPVEVPGSILYPRDTILDRFGSCLASAVTYPLALAIHEGHPRIQLLGLETFLRFEGLHRTGVEYLMGLARSRGIKVHAPDSSMLRPRHYGYEPPPAANREELVARRTVLEEELQRIIEETHFIRGFLAGHEERQMDGAGPEWANRWSCMVSAVQKRFNSRFVFQLRDNVRTEERIREMKDRLRHLRLQIDHRKGSLVECLRWIEAEDDSR